MSICRIAYHAALAVMFAAFAPCIHAVTITADPLPLTRVSGDFAVFTVQATGTGPLSYQWSKNGAEIPGARQQALVLNSVKAGDAANYSVVVSDSTPSSATSASAALTVNAPAAGDLDFSFGASSSISGSIFAMRAQDDGKVVICGSFRSIGGVVRNRIARLDDGGLVDHTFGSGLAGANGSVFAVAIQGDGKVLIGGDFTSVNGVARSRIARLNSDGTLDMGFGDELADLNGSVRALAVQSDGRVVIGGMFTSVNGVAHHRIARLHGDGMLDTSFGSGLAGGDAAVYTVAVQSDGKVLIGGEFSSVNDTESHRIARLDSDGTLDTGFVSGLAEAINRVSALALQSDGGIIIGGNFNTSLYSVPGNVARLKSDGTLDMTFGSGLAGANFSVSAVALQSGGKVLIGGVFTTVNGAVRGRIARLNSDGTLDASFGSGLAGANGTVSAVAVRSDGGIIIGGTLTLVNGFSRSRIARLNSDGTLDMVFGNAMRGANGSISAVAVQSDGKVLIGGDFTTINGMTRNRIARLNRDGTLESDFGNWLTGVNGTVYSVAVQSDGKVLIGGGFTTVNGTTRNCLARLNSDGTLDTAFGNGLAGANGIVRKVSVQSDGKVLICGGFTIVNGTTRSRLARLNSDGTLDTTFAEMPTGADLGVNAMAVQGDGKVLIGGRFSSVSGAPPLGIARFNSDGALDTSFGAGMTGADDTVTAMALQSDGKVIVGGLFVSVNGSARGRIARLEGDGTLDAGFGNGLAGANNNVLAVAVQGDGKVLIGGNFTTVNGVARNYIARLNSDGTLDTSFGNGLGGASGSVFAVVVQDDGKVLIGGFFTTVNGTPRNRIARLNSDGTLDSTFVSGLTQTIGSVHALALQGDGKVLIGGNLSSDGLVWVSTTRLNSDGTLDTSFVSGLTGFDRRVTSMAVQADGKVLIGGWFNSFNGMVRSRIARLNTDGTLDENFGRLTSLNDHVQAVALQNDGKVLVGGWFTTVDGVTRHRMARLHSNSTLDTGFGEDQSGANGIIRAMAAQSDGKLLIGGNFTSFRGMARGRVARLNADGTFDTKFGEGVEGVNGSVLALAVQSDGKIVIGGLFSNVNGVARNNIARLNTDGTLDTAFGDGLDGANFGIFALALQSDGKVLVGGEFTSIHGVERSGIARLNSEGTLDTSFGSELSGMNDVVQALALQNDGKILATGSFTSVNGTSRDYYARLMGRPPTEPTVTHVTPANGSSAGGTMVTITGTGFYGATAVTFGGVAAASFIVINDTTITATTAAGTLGIASVLVTTDGGTNAANTLFRITRATAMMTLTNLVQTYTGSGLSVGVTGVPLAGLVITYNGSQDLPVNAGSYNVVATSGALRKTGRLIVHKAPLTVTADNQRKLIGQPNPPLTFNYSGFLGADDMASVFPAPPAPPAKATSSQPLISTTAKDLSPGGSYPITFRGGLARNYRFVFVPGTLVVDSFEGRYENLLVSPATQRAITKVELTVARAIKDNKMAFSGRVWTPTDTAALPIKGALTVDPVTETATGEWQLTKTVSRVATHYKLTMDLNISGAFETRLEVNDNVFAEANDGSRVFVPARGQTVTNTGLLTLTLAPPMPVFGTLNPIPLGSGHATGSVDTKAVMKLVLTLADGIKTTATFMPGVDGGYRLFLNPYRRPDSYLSGRLDLQDHPDLLGRGHIPTTLMGDSVAWTKAAGPTDKSYRSGIDLMDCGITLDPWRRPAKATRTTPGISLLNELGITDVTLITVGFDGIDAPNLALPPAQVTMAANGKVTVQTPAENTTGWQITINPSTGAFTGRFTLKNEKLRNVNFSGVLRRKLSTNLADLVGSGNFQLPALPSALSDEIQSGGMRFFVP